MVRGYNRKKLHNVGSKHNTNSVVFIQTNKNYSLYKNIELSIVLTDIAHISTFEHNIYILNIVHVYIHKVQRQHCHHGAVFTKGVSKKISEKLAYLDYD